MQLTPKLLGFLHRVFDKAPGAFVALRIDYAGALAWTVADGVLTLTVTGGVGSSVTYDLAAYSVEGLVAAIAGRAGFEVTFVDDERKHLSALVLLDGSGALSQPNGGALLGYTSILWAIIESFARELKALRDAVAQLPDQMSTTTADGPWLDELGSYYGVPRQVGEVDAIYGQRIIAQTLRPISNNVAMERAIEEFTNQPCTVVDVTLWLGIFPLYDGSISYDGAHDYNTTGLPHYGMFDVTIGYDLIMGGDISTFTTTVQGIVERLRSAGTHLRALALSGAATPILDALDPPTESLSVWLASLALTDAFTGPTESFAPMAVGVTPVVEALSSPTEAVTGAILQQLTTEGGDPILTEGGDPIYAQVGALFV